MVRNGHQIFLYGAQWASNLLIWCAMRTLREWKNYATISSIAFAKNRQDTILTTNQ